MARLLIAHSSQLYADLLARRLQDGMEICVCHDGVHALELLQSFRPDAMVLDLHLPRKDGLTVLRQSSFVPEVALGTAGFCSQYIQRTAYTLGVSQLMVMPTANSMVTSLMSLLQQAGDPNRRPDARQQTRTHLQSLSIPTHLDGYKQLCVAIPLLAMDPVQTLSKELYPAVADILQAGDWRTVEHSIRTAIHDAWLTRDPSVWARYFPEDSGCPNNKRFLCRLVELIEM